MTLTEQPSPTRIPAFGGPLHGTMVSVRKPRQVGDWVHTHGFSYRVVCLRCGLATLHALVPDLDHRGRELEVLLGLIKDAIVEQFEENTHARK